MFNEKIWAIPSSLSTDPQGLFWPPRSAACYGAGRESCREHKDSGEKPWVIWTLHKRKMRDMNWRFEVGRRCQPLSGLENPIGHVPSLVNCRCKDQLGWDMSSGLRVFGRSRRITMCGARACWPSPKLGCLHNSERERDIDRLIIDWWTNHSNCGWFCDFCSVPWFVYTHIALHVYIYIYFHRSHTQSAEWCSWSRWFPRFFLHMFNDHGTAVAPLLDEAFIFDLSGPKGIQPNPSRERLRVSRSSCQIVDDSICLFTKGETLHINWYMI